MIIMAKCYIKQCNPEDPEPWCNPSNQFVETDFCQENEPNCKTCNGIWYACAKPTDFFVQVTSGLTCESQGYASIFDVPMCTAALQTKFFGDDLFEIDILRANTKPPGCSAADGPFVSVFGNRAFVNMDRTSERIYVSEYPNVGACTDDTPCFCSRRAKSLCPRQTIPYVVVESGTCGSNGYLDFLDMTECAEVLGVNFYEGKPFGLHDVTGVAEPPGCWPLTPKFLNKFTASSRAFGFEACIGRNQTEPRNPTFGYCSQAIPCYCKIPK